MPTASALKNPVDDLPDLSDVQTRQSLSPAALREFFKLMHDWGLTKKQAGGLLGGIALSTLYKWQNASGVVLSQDQLTRISYLLEIYRALHILFQKEMADAWLM